MNFPKISNSDLTNILEPAAGPVKMVIDTDPYNEVDDQFALTYAFLSPEALSVEACYAAPFLNERSRSPENGMNLSYGEIVRILDKCDKSPNRFVFHGSTSFLKSPEIPVKSEAAEDLVKRAMSSPAGQPLYVVAIAALTNVASAILMEPDIIRRIVVVWLGGHPYNWDTASEFNLKQDLAAAKLIFDCGVPLVHVPCKNVAEHMRISLPEVREWIKGCGTIGDYLYTMFEDYIREYEMISKPIWDIVNVAYMVNPSWVPTTLTQRPVLTDQMTWSFDSRRPLCRVAIHVNRDAIFRDLFEKLAKLKRTSPPVVEYRTDATKAAVRPLGVK